MTCGQNCPARFGGKTIECGLSRGHDPRQPHLAVVGGQNVTWLNSEAPTPKMSAGWMARQIPGNEITPGEVSPELKFNRQAFTMIWPAIPKDTEQHYVIPYNNPTQRKKALAAVREYIAQIGDMLLPPKELSGEDAAKHRCEFVEIDGRKVARETIAWDSIKSQHFGRFDFWSRPAPLNITEAERSLEEIFSPAMGRP